MAEKERISKSKMLFVFKKISADLFDTVSFYFVKEQTIIINFFFY